MKHEKQIVDFFDSPAFGVVGASSDTNKYGNTVLRAYLRKGLKVYPINPNESEIEGIPALADVSELPDEVKSISIITPPTVTKSVVDSAIKKNILNIWMQPGAQSEQAIEDCQNAGIDDIADGRCVLHSLI